MNRDKLIELIKESGDVATAVGMQQWVVEEITDHLIANGIGDITAEKHRAEVAEEALRNGAVGEDLYCSSDDERHRLYLHLIREAEQRLKERNNDRD